MVRNSLSYDSQQSSHKLTMIQAQSKSRVKYGVTRIRVNSLRWRSFCLAEGVLMGVPHSATRKTEVLKNRVNIEAVD